MKNICIAIADEEQMLGGRKYMGDDHEEIHRREGRIGYMED